MTVEAVRGVSSAQDGPPPHLRFKRKLNPWRVLVDLWHARELIRALAERDLRARYKQAVLGFAWASLTPLVLMLVFTVFFQPRRPMSTPAGRRTRCSPTWACCRGRSSRRRCPRAARACSNNVMLLNKVYCPREVFPLASVLVAVVDTLLASLVLVAALRRLRHMRRATYVVGPAAVPGAVHVHLRGHPGPVGGRSSSCATSATCSRLLLQLGCSPPRWPTRSDVVPEALAAARTRSSNPLAPVIDGLPADVALLRPAHPTGTCWCWPRSPRALIALLVGYSLFKRLETGFADVA